MINRARQVAQFMPDKIESGEWKPHRRIPSQDELANEIDASPLALGRATATLRKKGYSWTLPHKGSYARLAEDWRQGAE